MWQTSWQLVCAASILAAIRPVTVFLLMQRHLIAGLAVVPREKPS
jgi:ABC-type glycerol-3-phosphate transport system permease component